MTPGGPPGWEHHPRAEIGATFARACCRCCGPLPAGRALRPGLGDPSSRGRRLFGKGQRCGPAATPFGPREVPLVWKGGPAGRMAFRRPQQQPWGTGTEGAGGSTGSHLWDSVARHGALRGPETSFLCGEERGGVSRMNRGERAKGPTGFDPAILHVPSDAAPGHGSPSAPWALGGSGSNQTAFGDHVKRRGRMSACTLTPGTY